MYLDDPILLCVCDWWQPQCQKCQWFSAKLPHFIQRFIISVFHIHHVCDLYLTVFVYNCTHYILLRSKPCTVHLVISTSLCFPSDSPPPTSASVTVVALNEAGKVRVTWSRPTLGPGQVITGYSVQYRRNGTTSYTTRSVSGSSTTSYTITNLNLGTVYEVRVASVCPLGLSGYCCGSGKQITTYNCE